MPQCKHCKRKLYNWQVLKGHITLNVCGWCQPNIETHNPAPINPPPVEDQIIPQDEVTPGPEVEMIATQPKPSQDERHSASEDESKPLLQQSRLICAKHTLSSIVVFCRRWIGEAGMIKTCIWRVHKELAEHLTAEFHTACTAFR